MKKLFAMLFGLNELNPRVKVIDEKMSVAFDAIKFPRYAFQVDEFWDLNKLNAFLLEKSDMVVSVNPIVSPPDSDYTNAQVGHSVVYRVKVDEQ